MTARVDQRPTTHVWITQCLCPQRHCIMATMGEAAGRAAARETIEAPLIERIAVKLATRELNPWCGLCGARSGTWKFELARTRWRTMTEAMPEAKQLEGEQVVTAALWGDVHREKPN